MRHWTTSFQLVDDGANVAASARKVKAPATNFAGSSRGWCCREGIRIHDLRHTRASVGVGLGLPMMGNLLGHSQAATTERHANLDNDPLERASEHIVGSLAAAMGELKSPRVKDRSQILNRSLQARGPNETVCVERHLQ